MEISAFPGRWIGCLGNGVDRLIGAGTRVYSAILSREFAGWRGVMVCLSDGFDELIMGLEIGSEKSNHGDIG